MTEGIIYPHIGATVRFKDHSDETREGEIAYCEQTEGMEWCIRDSDGNLRHRDIGDFELIEGAKKSVDVIESDITPRRELLAEADKLVHSDRNATYGEPTQNFQDTAALWNIQFSHKLSEPFTAEDVAKAMIGLKLARMKAASKYDNWVDIAGYAACGWECETTKEGE